VSRAVLMLVVVASSAASHQCGSWQKDFMETQRAASSAGRWVVVHPNYGLGNRLYGAASALALALVTDRAFFIHDPFLPGVFRPKMPGIAWEPTESTMTLLKELVGDESKVHKTVGEWNTTGWRLIHMEHCAEDARERLTRLRTTSAMEMWPEDKLEVRTNTLWFPALVGNPVHARRFAGWGLTNVDAWFGCAMDFLFQLDDHVNAALQPWVSRMEGKFNIGLQVVCMGAESLWSDSSSLLLWLRSGIGHAMVPRMRKTY